MQNADTLRDLAVRSIERRKAKVSDWAEATGVEAPTIGGASAKAEGTLEFGGAIIGAVVLHLTFDSGEVRSFNGTLFGDDVGAGGGAGIYVGALPRPGEQWHVTLAALDVGGSVLQLEFNHFSSRGGVFTCPSIGLDAAFWNYGGGHWADR